MGIFRSKSRNDDAVLPEHKFDYIVRGDQLRGGPKIFGKETY